MNLFVSIVLSMLAVMANGEYCRTGFNPEECEDVFFPEFLCNDGCDVITCCGTPERILEDHMGKRNLRSRRRNLYMETSFERNLEDHMGKRNLRSRRRNL